MVRFTGLVACLVVVACAGRRTASRTPLEDHVIADGLRVIRDARELCVTRPCRDSRTVHLNSKDGPLEITEPQLPFIARDIVIVTPSDELALTGDIEGDRLVHLRMARVDEVPRLELSLVEFDHGQPGADLIWRSWFDRSICYTAALEQVAYSSVAKTGEPTDDNRSFELIPTRPVLDRSVLSPSSNGWERWSVPVPMLLLGNFRFMRNNDEPCD
jgi:hypothetical protein